MATETYPVTVEQKEILARGLLIETWMYYFLDPKYARVLGVMYKKQGELFQTDVAEEIGMNASTTSQKIAYLKKYFLADYVRTKEKDEKTKQIKFRVWIPKDVLPYVFNFTVSEDTAPKQIRALSNVFTKRYAYTILKLLQDTALTRKELAGAIYGDTNKTGLNKVIAALQGNDLIPKAKMRKASPIQLPDKTREFLIEIDAQWNAAEKTAQQIPKNDHTQRQEAVVLAIQRRWKDEMAKRAPSIDNAVEKGKKTKIRTEIKKMQREQARLKEEERKRAKEERERLRQKKAEKEAADKLKKEQEREVKRLQKEKNELERNRLQKAAAANRLKKEAAAKAREEEKEKGGRTEKAVRLAKEEEEEARALQKRIERAPENKDRFCPTCRSMLQGVQGVQGLFTCPKGDGDFKLKGIQIIRAVDLTKGYGEPRV